MAIFGTSYGSAGYGGIPASRGIPARGLMGQPAPKPQADPLTQQYQVYNTAVQQQAGDYGNIMQGYKDLLSKAGNIQPYSPSTARQPAIANLAELAKTGGYSEGDIANLRARAISPIRSVYAGAMRDVDRQRALQGGYSPNYGAVRAKMARELSEQVGQGVTNVNAQLAQQIAQGRQAAASPYASITGQEAEAQDVASRFARQEVPQQMQQALQGMTSLYGTTPALAQLFGNQALQGAQLQSNINQQGQQGNLQLIDQFVRGIGAPRYG